MKAAILVTVVGEAGGYNPLPQTFAAVTKNVLPTLIAEIFTTTPAASGVTGAITQISLVNEGTQLPQAYFSSTAAATLVTAWNVGLNSALNP